MQKKLTNIKKENLLKDIKVKKIIFILIKDFIVKWKREFGESQPKLLSSGKLNKI